MIRNNLFDGVEGPLYVYNQKAILNLSLEFFTDECDTDFVDSEEDYTFTNFSSAYFRVYNERLGTLIKNITTLSQGGGSLILNASVLDMTFEDNGNYYYEIGYVQNGGYEIALMFGTLKVL